MYDYSIYFDEEMSPFFDYSFEIKSLTIQNGITSIGNAAFLGCINLTSLTIPESVINIGAHAFALKCETGFSSYQYHSSRPDLSRRDARLGCEYPHCCGCSCRNLRIRQTGTHPAGGYIYHRGRIGYHAYRFSFCQNDLVIRGTYITGRGSE